MIGTMRDIERKCQFTLWNTIEKFIASIGLLPCATIMSPRLDGTPWNDRETPMLSFSKNLTPLKRQWTPLWYGGNAFWFLQWPEEMLTQLFYVCTAGIGGPWKGSSFKLFGRTRRRWHVSLASHNYGSWRLPLRWWSVLFGYSLPRWLPI